MITAGETVIMQKRMKGAPLEMTSSTVGRDAISVSQFG